MGFASYGNLSELIQEDKRVTIKLSKYKELTEIIIEELEHIHGMFYNLDIKEDNSKSFLNKCGGGVCCRRLSPRYRYEFIIKLATNISPFDTIFRQDKIIFDEYIKVFNLKFNEVIWFVLALLHELGHYQYFINYNNMMNDIESYDIASRALVNGFRNRTANKKARVRKLSDFEKNIINTKFRRVFYTEEAYADKYIYANFPMILYPIRCFLD